MTIPVFGVPILNQPDILDRMIESIDTDVEVLYVVDNGGVVDPDRIYSYGGQTLTTGKNLGVAASWNRIINDNWQAPWWFISNFDIEYAPEELDQVAELMNRSKDARLVVLGDFHSFALNKKAYQAAGRFDENFHPAYFEDNDYNYRCKLSDVDIIILPSHSLHLGSTTIKGNRIYRLKNDQTFVKNEEYYIRKWGGRPRQEMYQTPFDNGGSVSDWRMDVNRIYSLSWD